MDDTEIQTAQFDAAVRWMEGGSTSATHPVLKAAESLLLSPYGIECHYIVWDGFSVDIAGSPTPLIIEPKFNPKLIDLQAVGASTMQALANVAHKAKITLNGNLDLLVEWPIRRADHKPQRQQGQLGLDGSSPADIEHQRQLDEILKTGSRATLTQIFTNISVFLNTAFNSACLPTSPTEYSSAFLRNPEEFIDKVIAKLAEG